MCGRFFIEEDSEADRLIRKMNRSGNLPSEGCCGTMRPGDIVYAIMRDRSEQPALSGMKWGFRFEKDPSRLIFNARSETAAEKRLFSESLTKRRCVIPASGYFEWDASGIQYAIRRTEPILYLAAIWHSEDNGPCCTILTRQPCEQTERIHDRMPVILPAEAVRRWISPEEMPGALIAAACTDVKPQPARGWIQENFLDF